MCPCTISFSPATDAVDLECESSVGDVFARVSSCEAEFELVDILCTIDDRVLPNCKLIVILNFLSIHSYTQCHDNIIMHFWHNVGTLPLTLNRLDFTTDEHTLRIVATDSRGMTDSFELTFSGVLAGNLPGE